jgi:hypothetical protein
MHGLFAFLQEVQQPGESANRIAKKGGGIFRAYSLALGVGVRGVTFRMKNAGDSKA